MYNVQRLLGVDYPGYVTIWTRHRYMHLSIKKCITHIKYVSTGTCPTILPVLRIRDVYPDPDFSILDPGVKKILDLDPQH